jgi:hypothetical protein
VIKLTTNNEIDMDKLFKMEALMKDIFEPPFAQKVCSCVKKSGVPDSTFSNNECVMVSIVREAVTIPPERR